MRIAITCPAVPGHLNPSLTLAAELKRRGNEVLLVTFKDAQAKADAAGIPFRAVAEERFPAGSCAEIMSRIGARSGFTAVRMTLDFFQQEALIHFRELPAIWRSERPDGLVLDQTSAGATSAAQAEGLPYVSLASALWISGDRASPPCSVTWGHPTSLAGRVRCRLAHAPLELIFNHSLRALNRERKSRGLTPLSYSDWGDSRLAVVAQQPPGFEFPEVRVPEHVHFTGPLHRSETREPQPFPWERLDGRPLIYTSLGTIQNRLFAVFGTIAQACASLDAQLVISQGSRDAPPLANLPGNPVVVPFAPQLAVLKRAAVVITHAGLNTSLESLTQGVPMVAIPITNDQPGVAARLSRLGAAEVVPLGKLTAARLRAAVSAVLEGSTYRTAAARIGEQIAAAPGLVQAAEIVERALASA